MEFAPRNFTPTFYDGVVRLLIVDDQEVVRSALSACMCAADNFECVGEASNGKEAVRLSEELQPDVVLMDLVMPEMDGIEATRTIRERWPQIKVVALTTFEEDRLVNGVLDAGASAVLFKDVAATELTESILAIHEGRPIPPRPKAHSPGDPAHPIG